MTGRSRHDELRARYGPPLPGPWDHSRGTITDFIRQAREDVLALLDEVAAAEARAADAERERDDLHAEIERAVLIVREAFAAQPGEAGAAG